MKNLIYPITLAALFGFSLLASTPVKAETVRQSPSNTPQLQINNPQPTTTPDPGAVQDFTCSPGTATPCNETFKSFCAKVGKGQFVPLPNNEGTCVTPGGHNPDPF
jgi:hypothetical protein